MGVNPKVNPRAIRRLRVACLETKMDLSFGSETSKDIDCLRSDVDFHTTITRAYFEHLCHEEFAKIKGQLNIVFNDSKLS
jgi:heat shock 70kDa protein 1/2/6/8